MHARKRTPMQNKHKNNILECLLSFQAGLDLYCSFISFLFSAAFYVVLDTEVEVKFA